MRRLLTVTMLACGAALAAPVPKKADKAKSDAEAIQGAWVMNAFEGENVSRPGITIKFHFNKGGKLGLELGGMAIEKGGYKLDPTTSPKAIDIADPRGATAVGIYELNGDALKLCIADGSKVARPTEFKGDGKSMMLFMLKRVKDETKAK